MDIQIKSLEPGYVCLRFRGTISLPLHGKASDPLEAILGPQGWPGKVLLDFEEAEYIDSEGIAWLMRWQHRAKEAAGAFGVCAAPPRIELVFRLCQLHRLLPVFESEAAARVAWEVDAEGAPDFPIPPQAQNSRMKG